MFYHKMLNDFLFFFYALFIFTSTFSIAAAQVALGLSLVIFIILIINSRKNPFSKNLKWFYISIALYILWMVISALAGPTPSKSLPILKEEWLFCAVIIGVYIFRKDGYRNKILIGFGAGVILVSLYGIIQFFTGVHWFKNTALYESAIYGYMIKGFFPHRLTFGNYFATAAAFAFAYLLFKWSYLNKFEKVFWSLASFLGIIVTLLSHSYGPILALLGGGVFIIIFSRRKKLIMASAILLVLSLVIIFSTGIKTQIASKIDIELDKNSQVSRLYIWGNACKMTAQNPVFGVGQGNFYDVFTENNPGKRVHVHAHNDLLNIMALGGIPGMIFFSLIWIFIFKYSFSGYFANNLSNDQKALIVASLAGSVTFFISSLTEATFADEEVRQLLMFVWAAGLFTLNTKNNNGNITYP